MALPLDHPYAGRPHRVYLTLTNRCNRTCPWCSVYGSPRGNTWLTVAQARAALPATGPFELQLEGGEPTLHPDLAAFAALATAGRCRLLLLSTNGVRLPRDRFGLDRWCESFPRPLVVKLSINHHLLAHDPGLPLLARLLADRCGAGLELVVNVRLRGQEDEPVVRLVADHGLLPWANVFPLQRYGRASGETAWEAPFLAGNDFSLVNPDGQGFGTDLLARSRAMGQLP